jgi:hypothetical protein
MMRPVTCVVRTGLWSSPRSMELQLNRFTMLTGATADRM